MRDQHDVGCFPDGIERHAIGGQPRLRHRVDQFADHRGGSGRVCALEPDPERYQHHVDQPDSAFRRADGECQRTIINVGSGAGRDSFTITNELLKVLSQGDASSGLGPTTNLILSASQWIDLYGPASLGTVDPATGEYSVAGLTLNAPLIQGIGTADDVARIAAGNVTLQGATTAGTGSVAGQGTLQINSANLTLGPGAINLAGFGAVTLTGTAQVAGNGTGVIGVAGDLTVVTSANSPETPGPTPRSTRPER